MRIGIEFAIGAAVIGISTFLAACSFGSSTCKFDVEDLYDFAGRYIGHSKSATLNGLYFGRYEKAVISRDTIRRPTADENAQDIIGVVPIDVGGGNVRLAVFKDCSSYLFLQ